jgi:ParB family chromosome partitioning protein
LIPAVAEAFVEERITASHANLIARLPQEHQAEAFENCWRKDWQDNEAHLLPAKHLSAWIQSNLYLNLAEAPFDREDPTLKPEAGACVSCPRRSGFNTSLFADVQGDQCLDASCFQSKVTAHIDREIAARPELVTIETAWRAPKEQRLGALQRHQYRELDIPDNLDAEPPCSNTKSAIIVFGKHAGRTLPVCVEPDCPVHNPREAARIAADPPPVMETAVAEETEEEAAQRRADHEQRLAEYQAEQERKEEERRAEQERQQKEYEAEQARRDKLRKARVTTFERIIEHAPASFNPAQMRVFLRLLIHLDYSFLEEVASHFANDEENSQQSDEEIVLAALEGTADEKLTGLALRLVLSDHVGIPHESQPDLLAEAEEVFAPKKPKAVGSGKPKPTAAKPSSKKEATRKKAA